MRRLLLLVPLSLAACSTTKGGMSDSPAALRVAKERFEALKSLSGDWSGTVQHGTESTPTEFSYRVTADGNAVEEVLFKGTPHEMVTMYHLDGDRLMMTHYCAAGNQPRMVAVSDPSKVEGAPTMAFEFHDATNMPNADASHMHAERLWILDHDHIRAKWLGFVNQKLDHAAEVELTRK